MISLNKAIQTACILLIPISCICASTALQADPLRKNLYLINSTAHLINLKAGLVSDPDLARAERSLLKHADKCMLLGTFSVMDKTTVPPSGDKHDYVSLGRYIWEQSGRAVIRDGQVDPATASPAYDKKSAEQFFTAVRTLSYAYYFSGQVFYGRKAAFLLRTWFLDPATRMNPNLNFAQCRFGGPGTPSGIIDTAQLPALLDAASLLDQKAGWSPEDRQGLRAWAGAYLDWLRTSPLGLKESRTKNNHASWYDVQVCSLALYTGRKSWARRRLLEHTAALVGSQIEADGSQPQELRRTLSYHYSVYNLQALFAAALLGDKLGVDLWHLQNKKGGSIKKALDFLLPYALQTRPWPYQEITPIKKLDAIAPLLRLAAAHYGDGRYAQALGTLPLDARKNEHLLTDLY